MWWRLASLSIVLLGCKEPNPDKFCNEGSCNNPAFPFCDVSGAVSGEAGTCIAASCTANELVECRGDVEVRCNPDGTNYNLVSCDLGCDAAAEGCRLCAPSETACTNGQVAECDATGAVVTAESCPLGCFEDEPRCRELDPSNGLAAYLDMVPEPPDLMLLNATINTSTGAILDNGVTVAVPSYWVPAPSSGVPIRVFVVGSITIEDAIIESDDLGWPAGVQGPAFALLATGDVQVTGALIATPGVGAPPGLPGCSAGHGKARVGCNYGSSGGGGGGFGTDGGKGGDVPNNSTPGGSAGAANGHEPLVPLRGGCMGGRVTFESSTDPMAMRGGAGGAAVQIVSRTQIRIDGIVGVRGGPGDAEELGSDEGPSGTYALTGGGSGGALLLEAPVVSLAGNAHLDARGGDGADVCISSAYNCSMRGLGASASGGATAGVDINCVANGKATTSGSGGGGLGRVRFNTRDGSYTKTSNVVVDAAITTGVIETR